MKTITAWVVISNDFARIYEVSPHILTGEVFFVKQKAEDHLKGCYDSIVKKIKITI